MVPGGERQSYASVSTHTSRTASPISASRALFSGPTEGCLCGRTSRSSPSDTDVGGQASSGHRLVGGGWEGMEGRRGMQSLESISSSVGSDMGWVSLVGFISTVRKPTAEDLKSHPGQAVPLAVSTDHRPQSAVTTREESRYSSPHRLVTQDKLHHH